MTPKEEMLLYPHRDGIVSYLTHGFKGWDSPGPVDEATVEVSSRAWDESRWEAGCRGAV